MKNREERNQKVRVLLWNPIVFSGLVKSSLKKLISAVATHPGALILLPNRASLDQPYRAQ
jgi:hypothetical protein